MSIDKKIAELLGESMLNEEQLDELSKGTLGSYTKKTADRLAKEGCEDGYDDDDDDDDDDDEDDDDDQLDELSKSTLGSYTKKAAGSIAVNAHKAGSGDSKAFAKVGKRLVGVNKAATKLAKEDYELELDMSEDIDALMNGEHLTEEFKTKAATIFEAAVMSRVKSEVAVLEEKFDERLEEQVEEIKEGLIEKVDGYLDYVVEQWMQENEIALENGLKNEILESFITGMKGLFEQHYIDIPEEKSNILEQMQQQINNTELMLNVQLENNIMLSKELTEMKRAALTSELIEGMTHIDAEKFTALSEELAFDDEYSFKHKLQTIKENYFGKKQHAVINESVKSLVTDEVPVTLTEEKSVNPVMARYLRAFNGTK